MKRTLLIILAGVFCSYVCVPSKKTLAFPSLPAAASSDSVLTPVSDSAPMFILSKFRKPIRDKELYRLATDMVFPDTVYINRDTLHIFTKSIQECNAENFKLIWNGVFLKSSPPQAILKILQVADPACKNKNTFHLMYNLVPLRYKSDTVHVDKVIVKVRDYKYPMTYEY